MIKESCVMMKAALSLERKIVGVKLLSNEAHYSDANSKAAKEKIPYCVMVKIATHGYSLKSTLKTSGCGGGTRAIGLEPPSEMFYEGEEYNSFGLYENKDIAKGVASNITICKNEIYGVEVKPLELFDTKPDVVIVVTDSYNAMRIVQGYTYKYGTKVDFKLAGNQAVCGECTSYPYENDTINISMFCSGTRYLAGWKETEICIGMSFDKFLGMVEGLKGSINASETNFKKDIIKKKMAKNGLDISKIVDNEAYFM